MNNQRFPEIELKATRIKSLFLFSFFSSICYIATQTVYKNPIATLFTFGVGAIGIIFYGSQLIPPQGNLKISSNGIAYASPFPGSYKEYYWDEIAYFEVYTMHKSGSKYVSFYSKQEVPIWIFANYATPIPQLVNLLNSYLCHYSGNIPTPETPEAIFGYINNQTTEFISKTEEMRTFRYSEEEPSLKDYLLLPGILIGFFLLIFLLVQFATLIKYFFL